MKIDYETPMDVFIPLQIEFDFDLDVAASSENRKAMNYYSELDDGLKQKWKGNVWCNPPYGRNIKSWVRKGFIESRTNANVVVMLLPAYTDTHWFHDYCLKYGEVRFIRGRVKFKKRPRFASMIVIFRRNAS